MPSDDMIILHLSPGERATLGYLMVNFEGERTSSIGRKVKRVMLGVKTRDVENIPIRAATDIKDTIECSIDKDTADWLWDIYTKFQKWPTTFFEWTDTLEDKMRIARLAASAPKEPDPKS